MELVAFLGKDVENWGQIKALINRLDDCEKVILVKDKYAGGFPITEKCKIIEVDCSKPLITLKEEMESKVKPVLSKEFEVALSIASGNGKEHMAIVSALLNIPVGIRLVVYTNEGVKFIT